MVRLFLDTLLGQCLISFLESGNTINPIFILRLGNEVSILDDVANLLVI